MKRQSTPHLLVWLTVAAAAIAIQAFVRGPRGSMWWLAVVDAGHIPVFGLMAQAILRASLVVWPTSAGVGFSRIGMVFALAAMVGVTTEAAQVVGPRDADIGDLLRDALGAAAFLLLFYASDRRVMRRTRLGAASLGLILLMLAFLPLTRLTVAYLHRNAAFPRICDCEHVWEWEFLSARDAEVRFVEAPEIGGKDITDTVARVVLMPAQYPGVSIVEPYPDWQDHEYLVLEIFSEAESSLSLEMRVHDAAHDGKYRDRFNRRLTIHPGANRISIPLADIETAPRGRRMNMDQIRNITIFAVQPPDTLVLHLDAIHVE